MTNTQALRDLLVKVEAGEATTMAFEDAGFDGWAELAYFGSLDAAKALYEAVLPGFGWGKEALSGKLYVMEIEGNIIEFGEAQNPSRAWLIAILRALIAQATP